MNSYDKIIDVEDELIYNPFLNKKRNKIKLYKNYGYSNIVVKFDHKLINSRNIADVEELEFKIKRFLIVMNRSCKNFNSKIFLKNFKKTFFNLTELSKENKIGINGSVIIRSSFNSFKLKNIKVTYHELLHLASLKNDKNIFKPFNEGYTQLLEHRYFYEVNELGSSYDFEVYIMKTVEQIFGKDNLEKLYFNGEFNKIFNFFSNYISIENIKKLKDNLISIYEIEQQNETCEKREILKDNFNQALEILFNCLINKLKSDNEYNKLLENIDFYKKLFCFNVIINFNKINKKISFNTLEEKRFYQIIKESNNTKKSLY